MIDNLKICLLLLFALLQTAHPVLAQTDSSGRKRFQPPKLIRNAYKDAVNSMKRNPGDTINVEEAQIRRSEQLFSRYEGKIIRKIDIKHFGFERTFADTSTRIGYFGTRVLNALHTDTREPVIRQNLFIRENVPLYPAKLADNERFLRTLDFIQDARIFVRPVPGTTDSVDIMVVTKDLFSLTGIVDVSGAERVRARIAEANFLGTAQRIQATGLWEQNRVPQFGFELLYSKNNVAGTFMNATVAYTQINTGRSEGTEEEGAFYLRLERPLVSPFSHVAGGIELSFNQSQNVYSKPINLFQSYRYHVYDGWVGYNLGTRRLLDDRNYSGNRNRIFVSARYLQTDFLEVPQYVGDTFDPVYNTRKMLLGQVSFFRQDFYKLNYIYGFGTTEDVPTGYNVSFTGGWTRQLNLERPYAGVQAEQYIVTPSGGFIDAVFRAGGFYNKGKMEDAGTLASLSFFTPLYTVRNWRTREFLRVSISQLKNRLTSEQLRINNDYGLPEFSTDSVLGAQRISLYGESILYTGKKLFGFRFAPFASAGFSLINSENQPLKKADIYSGVGAGIRTRNENLVFGTLELHAMYFPRAVYNIDHYRVTFKTDIRFRYKTNFVQAPDIIRMNRGAL